MGRITDRDLEKVVDLINQATSNPKETWTDGKSNKGNYYISHAYGGVCLCQITTERGGDRDVLYSGHIKKSELYNLMRSYLYGIEEGKGHVI